MMIDLATLILHNLKLLKQKNLALRGSVSVAPAAMTVLLVNHLKADLCKCQWHLLTMIDLAAQSFIKLQPTVAGW